MLKIECCRRLTTHFIWSEIREFPAVANDVMLGEVIHRIDCLPLSVGRLGQRKPRFRSRMFVLVCTQNKARELHMITLRNHAPQPLYMTRLLVSLSDLDMIIV